MANTFEHAERSCGNGRSYKLSRVVVPNVSRRSPLIANGLILPPRRRISMTVVRLVGKSRGSIGLMISVFVLLIHELLPAI
jgi:hypothetical protein